MDIEQFSPQICSILSTELSIDITQYGPRTTQLIFKWAIPIVSLNHKL